MLFWICILLAGLLVVLGLLVIRSLLWIVDEGTSDPEGRAGAPRAQETAEGVHGHRGRGHDVRKRSS